MGYIDRFSTDTFICKNSITAYHLAYRNVRSTETYRNYRIHLILQTKRMKQTHESIRRHLAHQPCRHPVIRILQSPLNRNTFTNPLGTGITRSPGDTILVKICILYMHHFVAWTKTFNHRQRIEERLDSRTDLTASAIHHIILKVIIINTTHISLHITITRIHRHKAGTQEAFMVTDRVHRRHDRIDRSVPGEYTHIDRCIEHFAYLIFLLPCLFHSPVTVSLMHGTHHNRIHFTRTKVDRERSLFLLSVSLNKSRLQIFTEMLTDSFFRILLHTGVDRRIYFQTVGIKIIILAISFLILVAPTIERIGFPSQRIFIKLLFLPTSVLTTIWFFASHQKT